jgi:hypothetical protein
MQDKAAPSPISYHEYRVIAHLLRTHADEHQQRLKAMVAFGELVTRGDTVDIDLLEIVEGWHGKRYGVFSEAADLPLRGELRLYFLTPEEFRDPGVIPEAAERQWVEALLRRVRQGYEVIMEIPSGFARDVLEQRQGGAASPPPPSGVTPSSNPLEFIRSG